MAGMNMSVGLELQELQKGAKQAETILQKINNLSNIQGRFSFAGLEDNIKKLNTLNTELEKYNGKISVNRKAFHLKGADTSIDDLKKLQSALETFNGGTIKLNGKKIDPSPLLETLRNVTKEIEKENAKIDRLAGLKAKYKGGYKSKNAQADTKETIKGLEEQEKRFAELNKLHGTHSRQLDETRRKLDRLKASYRELNKIRGDEKRVGSAKVSATSDARFMGYMNTLNKTPEPNPELSRMNAYYKELEAKSKKSIGSIRAQNQSLNQQGNILQRLRTTASRYFSIFAIWNFVKNIVNTTKEFERQQVALEGIIGSAAKATQVFGQLKQMALKSPFNIAELTSFTKQLAAYNIAVDELLPTTNKLADLSAGLGVEMSRLILAYGQVNAASVLRGQELRQFTEAGVPLVQKLADKFTALNGTLVTTGEVFDMISKRQVSFDMVSQVLTDMTSEGGEFYKMQENLNNTIYGQIEKLKELWSLALKEIGDGSNNIIMNVIQRLQSVVKKLPALLDGIKVGGFAYIVKQLLQLNFGAISFARNLKKCSGIAMKLKFTMKAMTMMNWWSVAIAGIGLIAAGISNAIRKSKEWEKEVSRINESFAKDTAKLTVGFNKLVNKISTASENTKKFADAVSTLKSNYGDFVNDNIVQALINEARAAKEAGNEYRALAESIKASIEAKKEYERHETLKNTAAEQIMGELEIDRIFNVTRSELAKKRETRKSEISSQEGVTSENLLSAYRDDEQLMKIYRAEEKFRSNDLESAVSQAIAQMTSSNETTIEQFSSRFEEALKTYGFNEIAIQSALGNVDKLFGKIEDTDQWKTYLSEVRVISNDATTKIREAFEAVDVELSGERYKSIVGDKKKGNYNPLAIDKEEQRLYIEKYTGLLESLLSPEQFNKLAADKGYQAALEISDEDYGKGKALREAIFEYQKTLVSPQKQGESDEDYEKRKKVEQDVFNTIQNISNAFLEFAGTIGETADGIRSNGARLRGFEKLNLSSEEKDMLIPYLKVTEENVEQQQKALWSELDKLDEFIKTNENNKQFKERVDDAKDRKEILTVLTDENLYYGKKPENENGGGNKNKYEKIRITDFFDEWLSLITKAEDATKKIVGVTGYTDELGNFVNQLSEENYLRGFFEKDGNPFKDIFAKMTDVGITEFLPEFNQETLKNIFREAGWEEGKEISVPDFRAMYETVVNTIGDQVIAGLKTKRDQYAKGTPERNSLEAEIDRWQEAQAKYVKTMTTRWGGDEIEKKINLAIKELTNIGSKLDDIKSQRSMYERISKSSNPLIAKNALPDVSGYFSDSRYTSVALREMLRSEGGSGIASTLVGKRLKSLLNGGSLNIDNLSALFEIIRDLEEQAGEKEITLADGKKAANSDQFKETTSKVVDTINKLVESILKEYDKLAQYKTGDLKISDEILQAAEDFKNALQEIEETEKDPKRAASMKLSATQQYYDSVIKSLGGSETPDWIKNMFGDKDAFGGVSGSGRFMKGLSGGNSLLDMVIQSKTAGINKQYAAGEFGEVGSADAMQGAADKLAGAASGAASAIAMVDAIIRAVYQAINAIVELGKGILEVDAKVNNKLNLQEGADGKLYDKDGNLNIGEEYYEKQNRREIANQALDTIGHFNDHVMSGWEKLKSGDVLGAVTETVMSIADLIGDIFGTKDTQIQHQQDALVRSNENLARSMEGLEDALEDAAGIDKFDVQSQQIANLQQQKANAEMLLELENQKKNGDDSKAQDYADQAVEAQRQIDEIMDNIQAEVFGTADQLASTLTDPLVDAFRNGENAARAWRDAVKSYVSDVLKDILMTKVVAPKIQEILDQFMGDNTDSDDILSLFKDEDKVGGLVDSLNDVGTGLIDDFNNLPSSIKDLIGFNSEQSSLSGGISGITEDTARQLEGLSNSQLMQLILINRTLTQYLEAATTSSDNNQYMANVQTHLQQINNNVGLILRSITELRDTPSRPLHVTMV